MGCLPRPPVAVGRFIRLISLFVAALLSSHCGVGYTIYKSESKLDRLAVPMTKAQVLDTHGSSEQRVRWFRKGFDAGKMQVCDTFQTQNL